MPIAERTDVVVIGAGASGLMCASECGKRGRTVQVLDHAERSGSKVRISGGGRCNFTNLNASTDHYLCKNPHFCKSALARFTPRDILSLLEHYHIAYSDKGSGQMFCVKSARDIMVMLDTECARTGVVTRLKSRVTGIRKNDGFLVTTHDGELQCSSLVIATGGLSYPDLGASGYGHDIARQFGLGVIQPRPALVPFVLSGEDLKFVNALAGVSLHAAVQCGGKRYQGGLLFTHRGLSGPAILQASLHWERGAGLTLDLLPGIDLIGEIMTRRRSRMEMQNLLAEYLPKSLALAWCDRAALTGTSIDQTPDRILKGLAEKLHAWVIVPKGTEGYKTAEVTAGGVDTDGLSSKTMEAKTVPGLYFVGEVMDVTGELGGYNLHWAWASGFAAGQKA